MSNAVSVSEKLARIIKNSLSVSEMRIYDMAEKADSLSFDAIYLSVLREKFGFTSEMLYEIFKAVCEKASEYKDYSLSGKYIPQVAQLKEFGIDLEALSKEAALWQ